MAKSRDMAQVFVFIVVFALIAAFIGYLGGEFKKFFHLCFETIRQRHLDSGVMWALGKGALLVLIKVLGPIFLAGIVTAVFTGLGQIGGLFSTETITPKLEKLNPIEGLKNMFKMVTFIELLKNIAKIIAVFYLAYSTFAGSLDHILGTLLIDVPDTAIILSEMNMVTAAKVTGSLIFEFVVKVCVVFLILSFIDYAVQKWNFKKNMRMTKEEVKREYKQDEGDPAIKGERRRLHREMAFGDVKKAVKQSDVVVTNPIHVACALEYKQGEMSAPLLAMKGQHQFAELMVQIAQEEGVPVIRNIPLAWSLLQLEIGDEIPEDLYDAVAETLSLVYDMKKKAAEPQSADKPSPTVYV